MIKAAVSPLNEIEESAWTAWAKAVVMAEDLESAAAKAWEAAAQMRAVALSVAKEEDLTTTPSPV